MTDFKVARLETTEFWMSVLRFQCHCGYTTLGYPLPDGQDDADREMRLHLADLHLAELGMGLCSRCGQVTDWLFAKSELGDAWMCENCAPAASLKRVLGGPGVITERVRGSG